jgi:hypothetical protein
VEPPAPYVTDTKLGASGASRSIASQSERSISSVFGGKNSKETHNALRFAADSKPRPATGYSSLRNRCFRRISRVVG